MKRTACILAAFLLCSSTAGAKPRSPFYDAAPLGSGALVGPSGLSLSSDLVMGGYDITSADDIYATPATTDVAPGTTQLHGHDAFPGATGANRSGGQLDLSGGIGAHTITIADRTQCTGAVVTATVDGSSYTMTEGVHWSAITSNGAACTSLAATLISVPGISITSGCVSNVLRVVPENPLNTLAVAISIAGCGTAYNGTDGSVKVWTPLVANSSLESVGSATFDTYADFVAQGSNPAAPSAGTARFHAATTQGFTRFEQDNEAATNLVLGRDIVFVAKNTSGGTVSKGQVVYVSGSTGNVPTVALAKADSSTTLPAVGVALDAIADNAFGQVMAIGIVASFDTSAFSVGARVWVSSTAAGALTTTRPDVPAFAQRVGSILVSGVGNGSLLVDVAPHIGGMETGTVNSFKAPSFVSSTTNPAQSGVLRAANNEAAVCARNVANSADVCIVANTANYLAPSGGNGIDVPANMLLALGVTGSSGTNTFLLYGTAQTPDAALIGLGTESRNLIIVEGGDQATDFGHALQTNPTLFIQSSNQAQPSQWVSLAHDQTNAVIGVGAGQLSVPAGVTTPVLSLGADPGDAVTGVNLSNNTCVSWEIATPGADRTICVDSGNDLRINTRIFVTGDVFSTTTGLTAATMSANTGNPVRSAIGHYNWTNAMVTALGASLTGDINVVTLPAKTILKNAYVIIDTACTGVTTLSVSIGRTAASYIDYVVASDAKAAANTVYGDDSAERGVNLTGYDLPSFTGTTTIKAHFISTIDNLSAALTCTGEVVVETVLVP